MLPNRDSKLTRILLALFFLTLLGYAFYELRGFLLGPRITLPEEIVQSTERFIVVQGRADRIATLRMNGASIAVTQEGLFEEPFLLSPGLNSVVLDAEDKYGRTQQEVLQIVYTPAEAPLGPPAATSTSRVATSSPQVAPEGQ